MQSNELIMGTIPFSREGYDVSEKFIYYHCWQASLSMHCVTNTNPYLNIIIEVILKCITTTTQLAKISFSNGELAEIFFLPKYCIKLSDCARKCLHTHFYLLSQVHGTGHDWRALNTIYYHLHGIFVSRSRDLGPELAGLKLTL